MTNRTGIIERIYICPNKRDPVLRVETAELEADKGIAGDRYHAAASELVDNGQPAPENQLTLIAVEELDTFLANNDANIDYGDFRRSIITCGVDLNELVGKEFMVGDARCLGTELCEPCAFLASSVHRNVLPQLVHKAGIRAKVLSTATIETGDTIGLA